MISMITSVSNEDQYRSFFLPGLEPAIQYAKELGFSGGLDIIQVHGNESLAQNYNEGIRRAKYSIKVFVHQDVNLLTADWIPKILYAFSMHPEVALVGLVGTTKMSDRDFWWKTGPQYIIGEVFSREQKLDWKFNVFTDRYVQVEAVDGFFMATNRNVFWDENIKGFHLYDMDYCRTIRKMGFKIAAVPHKAWHISKVRENDADWSYYMEKWGLNAA